MVLVLSRKQQQEILVGDNVKITVLKVKGNTVRLGIEAPKSVRVVRGELTPIEEPMATVTVVIDEESIVQETTIDREATPARDVVPFRTPKEFDKSNPRMDSNPSTNSISFTSRLPKGLQHNRLKQIVQEISSKKR